VGEEVRKGASATVIVEPPERYSSPTATAASRTGASLGAPAATLDAVDTTVAGATDGDTLTVAAAAGITPGRRYVVTSAEWTAIARVRSVDGTTVEFVDPLPGTPGAGDTFRGIDITVALTATQTAAIGEANLLVVQDGGSDAQTVVAVDVVQHPYQPPLTAADVRAYLARLLPGDRRVNDAIWQARVAAVINERLRARLRAADRYANRYWDSRAFGESAQVMLRVVLGEEHGVYPRVSDPEDYLRSQRFELADRIGDLIRGTPYDADDDGQIDDDELPSPTTIFVTRG